MVLLTSKGTNRTILLPKTKRRATPIVLLLMLSMFATQAMERSEVLCRLETTDDYLSDVIRKLPEFKALEERLVKELEDRHRRAEEMEIGHDVLLKGDRVEYEGAQGTIIDNEQSLGGYIHINLYVKKEERQKVKKLQDPPHTDAIRSAGFILNRFIDDKANVKAKARLQRMQSDDEYSTAPSSPWQSPRVLGVKKEPVRRPVRKGVTDNFTGRPTRVQTPAVAQRSDASTKKQKTSGAQKKSTSTKHSDSVMQKGVHEWASSNTKKGKSQVVASRTPKMSSESASPKPYLHQDTGNLAFRPQQRNLNEEETRVKREETRVKRKNNSLEKQNELKRAKAKALAAWRQKGKQQPDFEMLDEGVVETAEECETGSPTDMASTRDNSPLETESTHNL